MCIVFVHGYNFSLCRGVVEICTQIQIQLCFVFECGCDLCLGAAKVCVCGGGGGCQGGWMLGCSELLISANVSHKRRVHKLHGYTKLVLMLLCIDCTYRQNTS